MVNYLQAALTEIPRSFVSRRKAGPGVDAAFAAAGVAGANG